MNYVKIKEAVNLTIDILFILLLVNFTILMAGLLQIAVEGRTGEWSPFFTYQAKAIVFFLA